MVQRGGYGLLGGFKQGTRSTKAGGGFTDWKYT